jgi:hypothetical protein
MGPAWTTDVIGQAVVDVRVMEHGVEGFPVSQRELGVGQGREVI